MFGERGAGWILTRDYLLRRGYAYVGYTLNVNKPAVDPKLISDTPTAEAEQIAQYGPIVNFEFMRRFDFARYAPLGTYYDRSTSRVAQRPILCAAVPGHRRATGRCCFKTNAAQSPLAGLEVQRVYVNSWAVTAQVWMDYLDQGRHSNGAMPDETPLIDAYMTGRMAYGEVGGDVIRVPRQMPGKRAVRDRLQPVRTDARRDRRHPLPPTPTPRSCATTKSPAFPICAWPTLARSTPKNSLPTSARATTRAAGRCMTNRPNWWSRRCWMAWTSGCATANRCPKPPAWCATARPLPVRPLPATCKAACARPWIQVPSARYLTDQETGCGLIYDTKVPYPKECSASAMEISAAMHRSSKTPKPCRSSKGTCCPRMAAGLHPIAPLKIF